MTSMMNFVLSPTVVSEEEKFFYKICREKLTTGFVKGEKILREEQQRRVKRICKKEYDKFVFRREYGMHDR